MIRAIFFDLDDTLIGYAEAERAAFEAGCNVAVTRNPLIDKTALTDAVYQVYEKRFGYGKPGFADLATLSIADMRQILTTEALRRLDIEPTPAFVAELNEAYEQAEWEALRPFSDVVDTLNTLAKHLPLGVITNGPSAMQRAKLTALELTNRFKVIVVDTEFGHSKPDTRIFEHAAQAIGLPKEELLFVGNSPEADVTGAMDSGWTCVWMNVEGEPLPLNVPQPHYMIHKLSELLTIPPVVEAMNDD